MSIIYQAQAIDEQMARLKLLFPDHAADIHIVIFKLQDNRVVYGFKAAANFPFHLIEKLGATKSQVKPAVDSLLHQLGITGVEQHIMINRHRFPDMQQKHVLFSGLNAGSLQ
ncbi:hypothetical protein [Methylophaga sp.]|uniref:hypothetical protein n=1 Tax=Methylophaga sp. TaxID=2024840 RepID=UPI003A8CAD24